MIMYQHDSPDLFRFVVQGHLTEAGAQQLEWAWETAKSILDGKELAVEVSKVTKADAAGINLLIRMRESGASILAKPMPECEELLRFFDMPAPAPGDVERKPSWALRILKAARFFA